MRNLLTRRSVTAGLGVAGLGLAGPDAALAATLAGVVETSRGECYAQAVARRRALAPAADVFVGEAVGTGTELALGLRLGTATQIRLGADSVLRIDRFLVNVGGILVLDRGALLYDHDESSGARDVTMRSPFGLVAVRGTRCFCGPSNNVFGVFVESGSVTVVGVNTFVVLNSGEGTNIERPGSEPTPPVKWGAARIAGAMASVAP